MTPIPTKAQELLDLLPPYESDDPFVQGVIVAYANELQRIEDSLTMIRDASFPISTDDIVLPTGERVALASLWERTLGLPVNPAGVSITERRAKIVAHIRKRQSAKGSDWVANLSEALGPTPWSYQEGPGDYQVTIHIPYASGSYSAAQVIALARQMTPAHIDVIAAYNEGFLIGISLIEVEPL